MPIELLKKEIKSAENKKQAALLQRFFKTGKGEYGEGDIFLGLKVPQQRAIAKKYNLELKDIQHLLDSKIHEYRMIGLFILIDKYKKSDKSKDEKQKKEIFNFYLQNGKKGNINNWDLIDLSSQNIIGSFLLDKKNERQILYKLARSKSLWEKRISVLSTFMFIRYNQFEDSIAIAETLLKDKHDLIHKAVGWMLREIGKRDKKVLIKFLEKHHKIMPRTMLRYSIEKLSEKERKKWMS